MSSGDSVVVISIMADPIEAFSDRDRGRVGAGWNRAGKFAAAAAGGSVRVSRVLEQGGHLVGHNRLYDIPKAPG